MVADLGAEGGQGRHFHDQDGKAGNMAMQDQQRQDAGMQLVAAGLESGSTGEATERDRERRSIKSPGPISEDQILLWLSEDEHERD